MSPPPTRITGLSGLYKGRSSVFQYPLITVGRLRSNGLNFPLDLTLSREHAQIVYRDGDWIVQDLGSSNGTYVNGHRLPPNGTIALRSGDIVKCGFQAFRLDWTPAKPLIPAPPVVRVLAQEPVVLRSPRVVPSPPPASHRIPPPPKTAPSPRKTPHRWLAPGERIEIHGRQIDSGLFFYGTGKRNAMNYGTEPSLIDPGMPVRDDGQGATDLTPAHQPSYYEYRPAERARYLNWLADGRPAETMHDADGLLFLAGIERRFLSEKGVKGDGLPEAIQELRRIASKATATSESAAKMREFLLVADPDSYSDADLLAMAESENRPGFGANLLLARRARNDSLLKPEEALLATLADEETYPRTPFFRCRNEATELFRRRVSKRYPDGVTIRTGSGAFSYYYSAANSGLYGVHVPAGGLREWKIASPTKTKLREYLTDATDALDAYSRRLASRLHEAGRLPAIGLLPAEIAEGHPEIRRLAGIVGESGRLNLAQIASDLPADRQPNKAEREMLARALWYAGFVAEPGPSVSAETLFVAPRLPSSRFEASPSYTAALPLVAIAALVILADGNVEHAERERARSRLGALVQADEAEEIRLGLYLDWLLETGAPKIGKRGFDAIEPNLRIPLLTFLAEIASADGHVSPVEAKEIVRIAKGLGMAEDEVYPLLHASHDRHSRAKSDNHVGGLDMDLIARKLVASRAASEILGSVFVDEEEPSVPEPAPVFSAPTVEAEDPTRGFLQELAAQPAWSAQEFAKIVAKYGKLPAAAYDELNEAALDAVGDPLLEGDDPISVDQGVAEEMLR